MIPDTIKKLQKELQVKNPHMVPRFVRVVVNAGVGKQRDSKPFIEAVVRDVAAIAGQQPHERRARKAVAGFNVRQGNLVGYSVTLRGKRMEEFIQRFVAATLPRVRDFRGIPLTSLDGHGNLSIGLREHLAFPEIEPDKTDVIFGVEVTFVTNAPDNAVAEKLFRAYGFPLTAVRDADFEANVPGKRAKTPAKGERIKS